MYGNNATNKEQGTTVGSRLNFVANLLSHTVLLVSRQSGDQVQYTIQTIKSYERLRIEKRSIEMQ
jgi:hypothetical protein